MKKGRKAEEGWRGLGMGGDRGWVRTAGEDDKDYGIKGVQHHLVQRLGENKEWSPRRPSHPDFDNEVGRGDESIFNVVLTSVQAVVVVVVIIVIVVVNVVVVMVKVVFKVSGPQNYSFTHSSSSPTHIQSTLPTTNTFTTPTSEQLSKIITA